MSRDAIRRQLDTLTTEGVDETRPELDTLSTLDLVREMNGEDARVAEAVAGQADAIAAAVDGIVDRFRRGGRLIYLGAGTAGRMGVLDASEAPPTFGTDPGLIVGLIAGGETAVSAAVENAEDDLDAAAAQLRALSVTAADTVVGVSASGRTPYVLGGLAYSREVGALTIAVASNAGSATGDAADIRIEPVTGPEFISGSTRLKSGTAQKMVLNMLTTLSMIKLGTTYRGIMVDLRATNEKLRARSERTVMRTTSVSAERARELIDAADGSVKTAIVMQLTDTAPDAARARLAAADGIVRVAVE